MNYTYQCPSCGADVNATAAYRVRQARPCLGCTRAANGWEHQSTCTLDPAHHGVCK